MNSNNLELSLIEHEIDKLANKYHLSHAQPQPQYQAQTQSQPAFTGLPLDNSSKQHLYNGFATQENTYFQENNMPMKSPSAVSFGTYNQATATTKHSYPTQQSDPLQELTMNKQGQVQLAQGQKKQAKVNPKDLSNEELEYIIRTGQIPPRLNQQQQTPMMLNSNPTPVSSMIENKTYRQQEQMQSTNVFQQNNLGNSTVNYSYSGMLQGNIPSYDKENFIAKNTSQGKIIDYNDPDVQAKLHRNYNSPKQINCTSDKSHKFQLDSLLMSKEQPIDKTLDVSTTSQAASQCLKALQDKISLLEHEKHQLLCQVQSSHTSQQLHTTLQLENQKLKDEITLLKRTIEAKELEKQRHLEENYSQQENLKLYNKRLDEENLRLKHELEEQLDKYGEIQGIIQDLKKRESQIRERCEKEQVSDRSKAEQAEKELGENKIRYEELKKKLKEQMREVLDENKRQKEQHQLELESLERERDRYHREADKLKREVHLLKEEVSIIGSNSIDHHQHQPVKPKKKLSSSGLTPKGSEIHMKSARCKSPKHPSEQVIRLQQVVTQEPSLELLSSKQQSTVKKSKKSTSKSLRNRSKTNNTNNNHQNQVTKDTIEQSSKSHVSSTGRLQSSERKTTLKTGNKHTKKSLTRSQSASKKTNRALLQHIASESQLISINTHDSKADNYIFIDAAQSTHKKESLNQYKRPSLESTQSILQFSSVGSPPSDLMLGGQCSQMSSIDVRRPMELQDIGVSKIMDRQSIDNQIFYLEREIFDCNQQYKTLLSQQTQQIHQNQTQNVNSNLRQIAQQLEEKSERLFELKKKQQQVMMQETYSSVSSGAYSMNYLKQQQA